MKRILISVPVGGFEPEQVAEVDDARAADWVAHGLAQYVMTPSDDGRWENDGRPMTDDGKREKKSKDKKEA